MDDGCCEARRSWSGTAELCAQCIRSALANWKCTRDKRTRGCRAAMLHDFERTEIINHVKERTWILSWYAGDQLVQLMVMLNARCCQDTLVQFLRRIAIMSENQTMCSGDNRIWGEFFDWVTEGGDYLYESKLGSHYRIHTQALGEEWTGEDDDVKGCSRLEYRVESAKLHTRCAHWMRNSWN